LPVVEVLGGAEGTEVMLPNVLLEEEVALRSEDELETKLVVK
jgi:hypothetical protein